MFDSLRGRRFSNKCKQAIKCIGIRLPLIRKKKQGTVDFMRKVVADLIGNGDESNAFGRVDGLVVEMNQVVCYDIIQQYCEYIKSQLPSLQNQRECPQEAVEAVATLIYAAARFPDLPELCELRHLFIDRYGNLVESSVNAEFVEKIQKKSFSVEKKVRLMQDIAHEYSVTWDCSDFEEKLFSPASAKIKEPQRSSSMSKVADSGTKNEEIPHVNKFEATPKIISLKQVQPKPRDIHVVSCTNNHSDTSTKVFATERHNVEPSSPYVKVNDSKKESRTDDQLNEGIAYNKAPWAGEEQGLIGLAKEAAGASVPHPLTRLNRSKSETHADEQQQNHNAYDRSPRAPEKPVNPSKARPLSLVPPPYYIKPKIANDQPSVTEQKDQCKDELLVREKPKPVSVRRRSMRLQPVNENANTTDVNNPVSETPNGRRKHDEGEEEDRVMDQLLVHYSKKGAEYEPRMTRSRARALMEQSVCERQSDGKVYPEETNSIHPRRAASFPLESISPPEVVKGPARAASLQPDILSPGGGNVHPRLPDYDELAARFMALKKA